MRIIAVFAGALLLIGGGTAIVIADQQRVAALEQARTAVADAREDLDGVKAANLELAETFVALRSQLAEQERQLADTTGMLP